MLGGTQRHPRHQAGQRPLYLHARFVGDQTDEGVLSGVLGIGRISQHPQGDAEGEIAVALEPVSRNLRSSSALGWGS